MKKFIIHDLGDIVKPTNGNVVFNATTKYAFCKGCFDCWLKTPGVCIIKDKLFGLADELANCDEFIIISECLYGGFGVNVKGVIDRLIAFNLPFFRNIEKELHHKPRYNNKFRMVVLFYGDINEEEKLIANNYVKAIAKNFNNDDFEVLFATKETIGETYENYIS